MNLAQRRLKNLVHGGKLLVQIGRDICAGLGAILNLGQHRGNHRIYAACCRVVSLSLPLDPGGPEAGD